MKTVEISFKIRRPSSAVAKHFLHGAPRFVGPKGEVKGLLWKIWLMNSADKSAGGIYLFRDARSATAYINGPIVAAARKCPKCSI